jgi:hypothetical protein
VIAVLLALHGTGLAQGRKPFALLPDSSARDVLHFCSRGGLQRVDGAWHPTRTEIKLLESRLADISRLPSKGKLKGVQISQPGLYYRQYIAVVVAGHKLIYVNAFSDNPPSSWRTRVVDICDTGPQGWGVLYNPESGHFSELRTNAMLAPPPPPPH